MSKSRDDDKKDDKRRVTLGANRTTTKKSQENPTVNQEKPPITANTTLKERKVLISTARAKPENKPTITTNEGMDALSHEISDYINTKVNDLINSEQPKTNKETIDWLLNQEFAKEHKEPLFDISHTQGLGKVEIKNTEGKLALEQAEKLFKCVESIYFRDGLKNEITGGKQFQEIRQKIDEIRKNPTTLKDKLNDVDIKYLTDIALDPSNYKIPGYHFNVVKDLLNATASISSYNNKFDLNTATEVLQNPQSEVNEIRKARQNMCDVLVNGLGLKTVAEVLIDQREIRMNELQQAKNQQFLQEFRKTSLKNIVEITKNLNKPINSGKLNTIIEIINTSNDMGQLSKINYELNEINKNPSSESFDKFLENNLQKTPNAKSQSPVNTNTNVMSNLHQTQTSSNFFHPQSTQKPNEQQKQEKSNNLTPSRRNSEK